MAEKKKACSGRTRILQFFKSKFPKKTTTHEIRNIAGIADYPRRIRELRAEGWQIHSHHDDRNLKSNEYRLASLQKKGGYQFDRKIDARTRAFVLQRNGYTCTACGRGVSDDDPIRPTRKVVLNMDHIDPDGEAIADNLRVLCSGCNQGKQDLILSRSSIDLLKAIRRAARKDQRAVYEWLKKLFQETNE